MILWFILLKRTAYVFTSLEENMKKKLYYSEVEFVLMYQKEQLHVIYVVL